MSYDNKVAENNSNEMNLENWTSKT